MFQYILVGPHHAPPDLNKSLATLKDAHVLFSASNHRVACFSNQEWDNWFKVVTKVPFNSPPNE